MSARHNLTLRILSGACLGAVMIWGVIWSNFVLNCILAVGGIVGGLEWTQIVDPRTRIARSFRAILNDPRLIVLPIALFTLWVIGSRTHAPIYFWELIGICAVLLLLSFYRGLSLSRLIVPGFLMVGATILSLLALHQGENWHALIFLLSCVSATDIGAFAFGKAIGGPKLAPRISPNKTVAGALGGMVTAMVAGGILSHWLGEVSLPNSMVVGLVLSLLTQMGDLSESALKRHFSVKDSGFLIPGHGGILDRIDGLLLAAPLFTLYRLWLGGPI